MPPEPEEEAPQEFTGPDPRSWPGIPEIWGLVEDIRVVEDVAELMDGRIAQDDMTGAYQEARRFLRAAGAKAREDLALMLLGTYGIEPADGEHASPFNGAGKPRAFGQERPADPQA